MYLAFFPSPYVIPSRDIEPKPFHTTPIPLHRTLTRFLRVVATAEEHAFVAGGFFVFADAAGLFVTHGFD